MDDNDKVPAKPEAEADEVPPAVEAEADKEEDVTAPEPVSEPAVEAEETETAAESTDTPDEKEADVEVEAEAEVEAQAEADAEVETEAEPEAEAEVVPAEDDTPAADDADNDITLDEPDQADAKSEKDLAEQSPELEPADDADPQEPEPESEPPSQNEPQQVVEEEAPGPEEPQPRVEEEPEEEEPSHEEPNAESVAEVEAEEDAERGRSLQPAAEITSTADEASRSSSSLRRASGHTEALIHAAAKEVLERLEAQTMETIRNRSHSRQDSAGSTNHGTELHYDLRSGESRRESYKTESRASRRESYDTRPRSSRRESEFRPPSVHAEDAADSSSQHGDSDVFSDRSPRSSLGSFDGHVDYHKDASHRSSKRSSRNMPDDVSISEMSYYDKEEFVPTIRGTNRMPFRSPSDVRALQYSSPAASVTGSYSPRSAKRAQMPTISRLGSPTVSGQYSTKGRKTPARFNPKKEPAPLVLLHVTLLPLRWQWAEILEQTPSDTLSPEAKTLREAWHHLHDRVADTVCERGILLSHPQEDYELLEERLLEALDLPLRRRGRVLECGHYIGPSNEMTLGEDDDSDEDEYDEDARRRTGALVKTHWCHTCRHDIRYESLGPGKIFRIKVYASNGLMRTGAWAACWKEMERVDVEIEPIVGSALLDELERLVFAQSQQLQLVKHDPAILESTEGRDMPEDRGMSDFDRGVPSMERDMRSLDRGIPALEEPPRREPSHLEENNLLEPSYVDREAHIAASSPSPAAGDARSPSPIPDYDESEERRLRDEERMREIYGHVPPSEPQHHEPAPESPHSESHHESFSARSPSPHPSSPAPQQQPEPQQAQSQQYPPHQPAGPEAAYPPRPQGFQNAGLGELLLEAARVFMQDKKNLAIVVMGLLVLFMVTRPAPREVRDWDGKFVEHVAPMVSEPPSAAAAAAPPLMETVQAIVESVASSDEAPEQVVAVESTAPDVEAAEHDVREEEEEVPVAETTASVADEEPAESTSASATSQTSAVEEEMPASEEVMAPPAPTLAHETIITRELVRIIETVTETVKAVITETEVVRVQATSSVVPEVSVEEEAAAAQAETPTEDATVEEAPATETVLTVEEPVDEQVVRDQEVAEDGQVVKDQEDVEDEHDEL
ncbi:hypothetical protein CGRA01v4_01755 [Colletotrichum graminicola]|uniref:Pathway-specific nitrogen regulator n=1 Tax=Colletotrichum graminicola (strain M1.001 / M2 / FGSC 10212) TaxID=645133 RepID=E3QW93_COLGM|nr:uncharacterized protein GLRG_10271 [Colletotrichum graminicola M1.001]EFQ35127.1 hypothetical protein GLRG_10271 [Colletotrichum graminicola M1.001]WDK10476.1 hypothetical protein CGRA01v4_01755 [Colletotrichum graminicola]